jgi:hypothetical protein
MLWLSCSNYWFGEQSIGDNFEKRAKKKNI